MLAAVRWIAVLLGIGAGGLTTTVLALVLWAVMAAVGFEDAPLAALTFALLAGFVATGWVAARMAIHSHRFHGMLAGLGLTGLIVVISRLGGSPAPTPQVLLLVAFALVLSGTTAQLVGKRALASRVSLEA